jgi:hypothetical protein
MSHDQNFKNLILDYPRQALGFFAEEEARAILADARIVPIRQEQLKERLGERFRELDIPLLVEWPDGRRAALLFLIEEETDGRRFSIHRLAHYCLDLAELFAIERVVPVVIFLRAGSPWAGSGTPTWTFATWPASCRASPSSATATATTSWRGSTCRI